MTALSHPALSQPSRPPAAASPGLHAVMSPGASAQAPHATASARGLQLNYGGQPVLDGLDLQLHPGQVVGLLGRNGAGKTSLLESLLGLRSLQAGQVELFGCAPDDLDDERRARIGYVPQRSDLFDWLTARQLLQYFQSFYPRWNTAKADGLMSRWAVPQDTAIARLSGGEQQRLAIVRALAPEPELLVLDEPVASLDPAGRRDFLRELVEQVLDRGTTVVFSTHILSDLERVAFQVAFMARGRIVLQAPMDELMDSTRRLSGSPSAVQAHMAQQGLQALPGRADGVDASGRLQVLARGEHTMATSIEVAVNKVSLEDLFMELTA
jgi:ABC-2 type transport system ATP-binding protein